MSAVGFVFVAVLVITVQSINNWRDERLLTTLRSINAANTEMVKIEWDSKVVVVNEMIELEELEEIMVVTQPWQPNHTLMTATYYVTFNLSDERSIDLRFQLSDAWPGTVLIRWETGQFQNALLYNWLINIERRGDLVQD